MPNRNRDYRNYVCPQCFYPLDRCNCEFDPYTLIMIDKGIQYAVRGLIYKGYQTISSCEAHFRTSLSVHIQFNMDYKFNSLPTGYKWDKRGNAIEHTISRKNLENEDAFNRERKEAIDALNHWVDGLSAEPRLHGSPRINKE